MRVALVFGQFDQAADPVNLPNLGARLRAQGVECPEPFDHMDTKGVVGFIKSYDGICCIGGSSLGAGATPIFCGYLQPKTINYAFGFQPSAWDPVMHQDPLSKLPTVLVPKNVLHAHCFRNSDWVVTGGLGYATWARAADNHSTTLVVTDRPTDVHPGDFGVAQDIVFNEIMELAR